MSIELEEQTQTETKVQEAKYYNLIFHNDETTHFDFVMFLLIDILGKSDEEAYDLTFKIHKSEAAPVHRDVLPELEALQTKITAIVLEEGFEFKTSIEED